MREAVTAGAIASVLHESQRQMIARALKLLPQDLCGELLAEMFLCEHQGGLLVKDGSRRRSLGGVFLTLAKARTTQEERRQVFG